MIFKDYYKILEIEDNKVTKEEIKQAYREQAKKYHPDVSVGYEERFKDINEAYQILSNTSTRRKYDRMWNNHIGKKRKKQNYEEAKRGKDALFSDFFNMFFGDINEEEKKERTKQDKKKTQTKGENIETEVPISIMEAFYGMNKKISLRTIDGKMKTFDIKVPAGIRNGEKIRLIGQGKQGQNGGKNGDLFIKIQIEKDNKFEIIGYDLCTYICITPWEAALGTRVNLEGIDDTLQIYIPAGIGSGENLKIPNKGYLDGKGRKRRFSC